MSPACRPALLSEHQPTSQTNSMRAKNRTPNAKSAPLPNAVRLRGAADERQRGPRGVRTKKPFQMREFKCLYYV